MHSLLLFYIAAMPAARILFTTRPKTNLSSCYILPQHIFRVFKIILKEMVKMITKFKFIRKKSEILNAGHGLMQYYPLLSPCSHSVEQAKERKFTIFYTDHNATCLSPQILHNHYLEYFSWDDCNTRKKLETMVLQSFGGNKGGLWS